MKTWEQARDEALANLERTHSADQYMIMINKMAEFGREWARAEFTEYYSPLIELERTLKEQNKEVYTLERAKSEKLLDALRKIRDQDYRGNRCQCMTIAYKVLGEEKKGQSPDPTAKELPSTGVASSTITQLKAALSDISGKGEK